MKLIKALVLVLCLFLVSPAEASQLKSVDILKIFPVLDNGRLKPLDTFARNTLLRFSAKDTYERKPAVAWLARVLFAPEETKNDKIFLINNPDIPAALNVEEDHHRRYSFAQLDKNSAKLLELYNAALKIPEKQRSILEQEILRVVENMRFYVLLTQEMKFSFPDDDFKVSSPANAKILGIKEGVHSFIDIAMRADALHAATEKLNKDKSSWTQDDKELMTLLKNIFSWTYLYHDLPLTAVPSPHPDHPWLSAWDSIGINFQDETVRQAVLLWKDMAVAYKNGSQVEFDLAARQYLAIVGDKFDRGRFTLENVYYETRPFLFAKICYVLVLILFVASFISSSRVIYLLGWGCALIGFVPHTIALISRMIIMARPPVSSLYETFIFVAFIGVLLGLIIEATNKRWLGLVVAGISGIVLLFIASKYSSEGDTMGMLIAVLNSNFWLGTHVLTITMGYGAACVAGVVGHIWLVQKVFKKDEKTLTASYNVLMGMLALALTLTFFGTNLGGIWADQSWGRFWGWDPKENGALMIVLWCSILFHAKFGRMIGQIGMAVGAVFGIVVVAWAWFGVNLLNVGLHSYGFTSGIAASLTMFVVGEMVFIAITTVLIHQREKKS
jgi:ABC-type transport system involved in cytochrome c biogenesis permease subunit